MEFNFVIFDLEATCWRGPAPNGQNEIIEIGAVRMDIGGEYLGEFRQFVKPVLNPLLSPFCKSLTGITQEQVNAAQTYKYVIRDFIDWGRVEDEHTFLISWGENDKLYLHNDCKLHKIDSIWLKNHIDLKKHFRHLKRLNNYVSLKRAIQLEGMEFEGDRHRAFDDAYNLSRVFGKHIDQWSFY